MEARINIKTNDLYVLCFDTDAKKRAPNPFVFTLMPKTGGRGEGNRMVLRGQ